MQSEMPREQQLEKTKEVINALAQDRRTFIVNCIYCNKACNSAGPMQTFAFMILKYDMSLNVCICTDCLRGQRR